MRSSKLKRVLSLMCTVVLMATSLFGCGEAEKVNTESEKQEVVQQTQESQTVEEEKLEYVELDWYAGLEGQPDKAIVVEKLNEYLLEKLNLKLNVVGFPAAEAAQKMTTMINSGQDMGIITIGAGVSYLENATKGAFYPMSELLEKYGAGTLGMYSEDIWGATKVDGEIYMIPTKKDLAQITGLIYNSTMAEELGLNMEAALSEIKDLADGEEFFKEVLKLRNEKYPEYVGKPILPNINHRVTPHFFGFEGFGINELAVCNIEGIGDFAGYDIDEVFNVYATDEFRELCLLKQRLAEAGVIAADPDDPAIADWSTAPYMFTRYAWGHTYVDKAIYSEEFDSELYHFDKSWTSVDNILIAGSAISASCKHPERAMMFLELLHTDPYLSTLLHFGVEGEHWVKDSKGVMTFEGTRNADPTNRGYYVWYGAFGNLMITDVPDSVGGPDNYSIKVLEECFNNALVPSHMGFVLDLTPIQNEIAACNNVVAEYRKTLLTGNFESADAVNKRVDEFNAKLVANGSEKIIAEVQAQLDAWISANK